MAGTSYKIFVPLSVEKQLAKIPKGVAVRIRETIHSLSSDPRPAGTKKLKGTSSTYRLREGDYRILYEIEDHKLIVLLVRVGHRREVYSF